ncbi:MAG: MltA domain-containing protein [Myxococcaceae bacterium]|nr:MltA domain-containing protein [Myxococcaceae bacterium]MCI0669103.1 MltA domain-containing protein [Myxococcaceae bacterium]
MKSRFIQVLGAATLGLLVSGCPRPSRAPVTRPEEALVPSASPVSLLDDGEPVSLRAAVRESLVWLRTLPPERSLVFGRCQVPASTLVSALERFSSRLTDTLPRAELGALVHEQFALLEAAGDEDGTVLFTGYYEPTIEASLTRDDTYSVPIFGLPEDLVEVPLEPFAERFKSERVFGRLDGRRVVPYWTRAEIAAGKLGNRKLELAWAKDPVALFFLEVQGSGTLRLPDGSERRIGYAASNGRPYRSIGSLLIQEGAIPRETMSMQALRAWLAGNDGERDRVLHHNESYVFFRFLDGAAVGSLGRPVTPGRSIATDARLFPRGALAFLQTERPVSDAQGTLTWQPLSRLVLNQDTGGAIRGAGRVDMFWGRGADAELAAGLMKQKGRLFFLVPRGLGTQGCP